MYFAFISLCIFVISSKATTAEILSEEDKLQIKWTCVGLFAADLSQAAQLIVDCLEYVFNNTENLEFNITTLQPTTLNITMLKPTTLNITTLNFTTLNITTLNATMLNITTLNPTVLNITTLNPTALVNMTKSLIARRFSVSDCLTTKFKIRRNGQFNSKFFEQLIEKRLCYPRSEAEQLIKYLLYGKIQECRTSLTPWSCFWKGCFINNEDYLLFQASRQDHNDVTTKSAKRNQTENVPLSERPFLMARAA